jgi:hypothetical protein
LPVEISTPEVGSMMAYLLLRLRSTIPSPMRLHLLLLVILTMPGVIVGQVSTEQGVTVAAEEEELDSAAMARVRQRFNPEKALLYASILPGSGQVYNKKYWKVPLVYGGFAFLGYYINSYNNSYRKYRGELFEYLNTGTSPSGLPENTIRTVINRYKRERDFFIILAGAWYGLQILDAHVDAHLKEFQVNPNLRVRVEPSWQQDWMLGRQTGFTVSVRF